MSEQSPNTGSQKGVVTAIVIATLVIIATVAASTGYIGNRLNVLDRAVAVALQDGPPLGAGEEPEEPPQVDVSKLVKADDPQLGPKDAKVTIVEFSDYECPFCGRYYRDTYKGLKEKYGDKVRFVFKDFPLPFHQKAQKASEAAHCAGEQGKYWEYHDVLFENQRNLSEEELKGYARKLNLDGVKFDACLGSERFASKVRDGLNAGRSVGVSGTPTFFINGRRLVGAQPSVAFERIIDEELGN